MAKYHDDVSKLLRSNISLLSLPLTDTDRHSLRKRTNGFTEAFGTDLVIAKASGALVLLLISVLVLLIPLKLLMRTELIPNMNRVVQRRWVVGLQCVRCFSAGGLLGISFLHLMPDCRVVLAGAINADSTASRHSAAEFPLTELLIIVGLIGCLYIEKAIWSMAGKQSNRRRHSITGSYDFFNELNSPGLYSHDVIDGAPGGPVLYNHDAMDGSMVMLSPMSGRRSASNMSLNRISGINDASLFYDGTLFSEATLERIRAINDGTLFGEKTGVRVCNGGTIMSDGGLGNVHSNVRVCNGGTIMSDSGLGNAPVYSNVRVQCNDSISRDDAVVPNGGILKSGRTLDNVHNNVILHDDTVITSETLCDADEISLANETIVDAHQTFSPGNDNDSEIDVDNMNSRANEIDPTHDDDKLNKLRRSETPEGRNMVKINSIPLSLNSVLINNLTRTSSHHSVVVFDDCDTRERIIHEPPNLKNVLTSAVITFYGFFDGFAIGIQRTELTTWIILATVCLHRSFLAFVLGLEYERPDSNARHILVGLVVFALFPILGVSTGMIFEVFARSGVLLKMLGVLQSLTTGAMLYTAFFVVIYHEIKQNADFIPLTATLCGFSGVSLTLGILLY